MNLINEITNILNLFDTNPELMDDFMDFSDEIDRVKDKTGMSEEEINAINFVQSLLDNSKY